MTAPSNQATYRVWADGNQELPLFYQPFWLDAVCGDRDWQVALVQDASGRMQAVQPYWTTRRYGLSVLTHPPLTPRLGPWVLYPSLSMSNYKRLDYEEKVVRALDIQLPPVVYRRIKCHPLFRNAYPHHLLGYQQTTAYTYQLDLSQVTTHWSRLEDTMRNKIRKAREHTRIQFTDRLPDVLPVLRHSLPPADWVVLRRGLLQRTYANLQDRQAVDLRIATTREGEIVAASLIAYDAHRAYNLLLGVTPAGHRVGAAAGLLWEAILQARQRATLFDFEGSMLPGVERFFRGFRPQLVPYHVLTKGRWTKIIGA